MPPRIALEVLLAVLIVIFVLFSHAVIGNRQRELAASLADAKYFTCHPSAVGAVAAWLECMDRSPAGESASERCVQTPTVAQWIEAREAEFRGLSRSWPLSAIDRHWPTPAWK